MIARRWSGRVPLRHAAGFAEHLRATGVSDYRAQSGCMTVTLLRRDHNGWAEFELTSLWSDRRAIAAYAGHDIDGAVLYPGDEAFELVPDRTVTHFEVVAA